MTRLGWRLRALIQRHLAVHGGWYAAERSAAAPAADIAALVGGFLAGKAAPEAASDLVGELSRELAAEWERRDHARDPILQRITALADRAGVGRAGADLLAVVAGPALDRTYGRFVRAVVGRDGVPAWFARGVVDPAGDDVADVAAAWARLDALGLFAAGGEALAADVETWLATGEAPVPAGAVIHGHAACARRAALCARWLGAAEATAGERVVVIGPPDMGAGWIAASVAARLHRPVLAAARADAAVVRAALLHEAVLLVNGAECANHLQMTSLGAVIRLDESTSPAAVAALAGPLGAAVVELGRASRVDRLAWWTSIAGDRRVRPGELGPAQLAAYPVPIEAAFELAGEAGSSSSDGDVLDRGLRAAAASALDGWCRRLAPARNAGELPPQLAPELEGLRRQLASGAPGRVHLESHAPVDAAAALCTAAGVELFVLSAHALLGAPEGAVARAACALALAAERGAALLFTGLDAIAASAHAAAITALIAEPIGVVILPSVPRGAS